ncbi:hypothetical protein EPN87_03925 [archaeon]|nr:MAG: hypothetical protein EPN87_03925 [archaeon]
MPKKKRIPNIILAALVVFVILYGINIALSERILSPYRTVIENAKPANLQATLITNDCSTCFNMDNVIAFIKSQNATITQKNISYANAQNYITTYNIKSLPALVITGDVNRTSMSMVWHALGASYVKGAEVVSGIPPYYSLDIQDVIGVVQVIKLTDSSCQTCYDADLHMQILPGYGVYVSNTTTYDVSSANGNLLVQKYNITRVPTILLSPDAAVYTGLNQVWGQVGTIESDGWYVFRTTQMMGTYKLLTNNTIINAPA